MAQFLHLGVPVAAPRPGMQYKEDLRVWVSDPADDPFQRELVCYEPGTPFPPGVQNRTHTAWQVDALAPVLEQADAVLFGPVERGGGQAAGGLSKVGYSSRLAAVHQNSKS